MEVVWFFFKVIETMLGAMCMALHIEGLLDDLQPFPHQMYFCGTFFGFTFISIIGIVGISSGLRPSWRIEAIVTSTASFFFLLSSVFSMYHAERDFHLMYLSDYQESVHPFFAISKKQSITSLCCGLFYMLHAILLIDGIFKTTELQLDTLPNGISKLDIYCYQPIQLFIGGKNFHDMLMKQEWFLNISGQRVRDKRDAQLALTLPHHGDQKNVEEEKRKRYRFGSLGLSLTDSKNQS